MASTREPFPWWNVSLLGVLTIAAYGSWYYSFGVLLDPIVADTGWPQSSVVASFGGAGIAGSLIAPYGGRAVDTLSPRLIFAATGLFATAAFWTAAWADALWVFITASAAGGAVLAGFGFYHVAQTVAVRTAPADVPRAVGLVTLYGAFASTLYLPLAAWLVTGLEWRSALRILATITGVVFLAVALALPAPTGKRLRRVPTPSSELLRRPSVRRYALASAAVGAASGIILVYQVPVMVSAGLTLTTAAWLAGLRGVTQFLGRVPVTQLVNWLGTARSLKAAFLAIAAGAVLLGWAVNPMVGFLYVVVAGFGIGATSPLQGIYGSELFGTDELGQGMGVITMVFGLAASTAPAAVAVLNDIHDTRWWAISISASTAFVAALAVRTPQPATG
ncbi:MAG: MFS transporter [Acidimicrobiales bacterium]|nr:MFS transporter [Acidimicrobiales bacterium]